MSPEYGICVIWDHILLKKLKKDEKTTPFQFFFTQTLYYCQKQWYTVAEHQCHTPSREERRFLYFNHLSKEFLNE